VSAKAAALAEGALRTMTISKLKLAVVAALVVGLAGVGLGGLGPMPASSAGVAALQAVETPPAPQPQAGKDQFGDPLPPGAVARLGTLRLRHSYPVNFLALLPDGKTAVSAADDRYIRIWDLASGKELRRFGPGGNDGMPSQGLPISTPPLLMPC